MTQLALYESAKEALAEALRVDEVLSVRDTAERIKLYGRQAKDKRIIADATALMLRAERKLGVLLINAKETGELGIGRPGKSNLGRQAENGSDAEPFQQEGSRATLKDVGIDKKLSARSQRWAKVGDAEFEEHLQKVRDKIESEGAVVVNPLKDLTTSEKKARRAAREAELGRKQAALPEAKFGVIYADPEWKFETHSEAGLDRAADNHYPTSSIEALKARDVGSLAADDCVLFLWVTVPMLRQAMDVLEAWGFAYKSNFEWRKDKAGTGFWNRNRHEHLLIATRGNVPAPAMGEQFESSIEAPVGAHSQKPDIFYEIIESYFPTLPKIELNARQARAGWGRWGLEAPPAQPEGNLSGGEISAHQGHESYARMAEAPEQDTAPPSEGHEGQDEQERTNPGCEAGTEGSSSPLQRSSGADAQLPDSLQAEPETSRPAGTLFRFTPADDAVLRAAYGLPVDRFDLGIVAATIGCTKEQAKKRAAYLKLGSRDRQRHAVAEANRRRAN